MMKRLGVEMRFLVSLSLLIAVLTFAIFVADAQLQKVVLNAKSTFTPALLEFNGGFRIAWTTRYEIRIALWVYPNFRNDHGLREFSYHAPALAVFNNRLYIAWAGTDKYALLNVKSSQDGEKFSNKVTLREDSAYGPALAVFNNRLYLAWTGVDPQHSLNIISSADGVTFSAKQILGQSSMSGPALTATAAWPYAHSKEKLFITWTGPDKAMNIAGSDDGVHFDFSDTRVPSETSNDRPVLFAWNNVNGTALMTLWFTGTDSRLNSLTSVTPPFGSTFNQKKTFDDTSVAGPSMYHGYLGWSGTDSDHHINIRLVQ
jgi:hypothetical protein